MLRWTLLTPSCPPGCVARVRQISSAVKLNTGAIIFAWPGIGRLALDAVFKRDYPLLLGIYLLLAISISIAILVTDVVYALLDPRIRLR